MKPDVITKDLKKELQSYLQFKEVKKEEQVI